MRQYQNELREKFFSQIRITDLLPIFNMLNNTCFFIKDVNGRLIAGNQQLLYRYNLEKEENLIGKTDFDFVPRRLAEKYKKDDMEIIASRSPRLNMYELVLTPLGSPGWYITDKIPLLSPKGDVIGIMGLIKEHDRLAPLNESTEPFYKILEYIDNHVTQNQKITVAGMAHTFNVSQRYIQRCFQRYFNLTPQSFIIQVKILKACDYLKKGQSIAFVAEECGFYDQSSFTKHFKKYMGITPIQYIKNFT